MARIHLLVRALKAPCAILFILLFAPHTTSAEPREGRAAHSVEFAASTFVD